MCLLSFTAFIEFVEITDVKYLSIQSKPWMTSDLNLRRDCTGILNVSNAKIKQKCHIWSDGAITVFCLGAVEGSQPQSAVISSWAKHRNQGARLGHQTPNETYVSTSGRACSSRLSLWLMNTSVGKAQTHHNAEKRQNILSLFCSQRMTGRNPEPPLGAWRWVVLWTGEWRRWRYGRNRKQAEGHF